MRTLRAVSEPTATFSTAPLAWLKGLSPQTRAWLLGLWVLATALNLTKPFHIDDIYYLEEAVWIADNPTRPMSGEMYWITDQPEPFHLSNNSPVLIPYVQAAVIAAVGVSPIALHALTAVFAALAIVFFYALAERHARPNALVLTAVFVLAPSFLAEQNIMLDVPLVASWLLFFLLFEDGSEDRHWWRAASVAAVAVMIKFTSFALIFFLILEALRTKRWRGLLALSVPGAVLAAWSTWNWFEYGGIQILARPLEYGAPQVASGRLDVPGLRYLTMLGIVAGRGALWLVTLGGILTGYYALVPQLFTHATTRRLAVACVVLFVVALPIGVYLVGIASDLGAPQLAGEPLQHTALRGLFFFVGLAFFVVAVRRARAGDGHDVRFLIWIVCALLFVVGLSPFVAARHVLVAFPAVLLLVARSESVQIAGRERAMIGIAAVLGVWLAISDHRVAAVYRDAADRLREDVAEPTRARGGTTYFVGHWGWQFYGKEAGFVPYVPDEVVLLPGDVLIEPEGVAAQPITEDDRERLVLVDTVVTPSGPIDVLRSMIDREGLYCVWVGLPWSLRTEPLERFFVFEVSAERMAER